MAYHKLNRDDIQVLVARREAGESAAELAKAFGVCTATINNYLRRAGVARNTDFAPKLNEHQRTELVDRFRRGESVAELARQFGISHSSATKLIIRRTGKNPGRHIRAVHVFPPADPMEIVYLAAMIDAEGCITRNSKVTTCTWQVVITNTSPELRSWLEQFGGAVYDLGRSRSEKAKRNGWKKQYEWHVTSAWNVYRLLRVVRPYLKIKGGRADEAMADIEERFGAPPEAVGVEVAAAAALIATTLGTAVKPRMPLVELPRARAE